MPEIATDVSLIEKLRTFNPAASEALDPDLVAFLRVNHGGLSAGNRLLGGVSVCTILDAKVQAECRALKIGFYDRVGRLFDEGKISHYFTLTGGAHLGSVSGADEHVKFPIL